MNRKTLLLAGLIVVLAATASTTAFAQGQSDLAAVRGATAAFHYPSAAQAAGWDLRPGLDYCFQKPSVGAMGYHYINTALLDLKLDAERPEAMVYATGRSGRLQLAAVEYIVPAAAWDAAGNTELPTLLGQRFHLNQQLGVYVLHAWIWNTNRAGMFEDWNPDVVCRNESPSSAAGR